MMAIFITILALPFRMLIYMFKHPRLLVLVGIGVFVIIGIRACNNVFNPGADTTVAQPAAYQDIAPDEERAPYVLSTATRIYYVSHYNDDNRFITLEEYYTYDQKEWAYHGRPLRIDRRYYGEVTLYERKD